MVVVTVKPDGVSSKPVPYKVVNRYFRILCQAPGMHPVVDKMRKVALGIYSIAEAIRNFKVLAIKCDISGSS